MKERYIIRIDTTDKEGVINTAFLLKDGKTYTTSSLLEAIQARDNASKWVKGEYMICILQELPNV